MIPTMIQMISICGAILILGAYALLQTKVFNRENVVYNLLNLIGSLLLAFVAVVEKQIGLGTRAMFSAYALWKPDW